MKRILILLLLSCVLIGILPTVSVADSINIWDGRSCEPYSGGVGTESDPYLISNAAQFYQLSIDASASTSATNGMYYKLTQDIDMGNKAFPAIAHFSGTLDASNHTIKNLKIINSGNSYTGLIMQGDGCTVRNITIEGSITGTEWVGGIIGYAYNNTLIENCINRCVIIGKSKVGGICGYSTNTTIQNCHNKSTITTEAASYVGGIVGYADTSTTLQNCSNVESVSGNRYIGGIVGYSDTSNQSNAVTLRYCANAGAVTGQVYSGGIVGYAHYATYINNCYNCGHITSSSNVGGIIGYAPENYYYHNGKVATYAGYNDVSRSYNCGLLSGSNCYDPVNEYPYSSYIYYLSDNNHEATHPSSAVGLSSEEMASVGGFVGFDFTDIWTWDNSGFYNYPILRNLGVVLAICENGQHSWNEGTLLDSATCTEDGLLLVSCTKCATTQDQVIPATGHEIITGTSVPPSCTESGLTAEISCAQCDYLIPQEIIPPLEHEIICDPAIPPTCTTPGLTEGCHCSRCSYLVAQEVIPEAGHNYATTIVKPECTEIGYTIHTCSNCGNSYNDTYVSATGHAWDNGVEMVPATCEKNGEKVFTCSNCGKTKVEETTALDHNYVAETIAPSCTEIGYTIHTCQCNDSYITDYTGATGHSWLKWAVSIEPTATTDGEKFRSCGNCGATEIEAIPAKPKPTEPKPTTPPVEDEKPAVNPFVDVPGDAFYHDPVLWAVDNAVTNGLDATHFGPDAGCTRAHVVTFLWRAAGEPAPSSSYNPFTDVLPGAYYYDAVLWAVEKGITNGVSATAFAPDQTCTRGQIVTFLWRYQHSPSASGTTSFIDIPAGQYYSTAVAWAVANSITNGMGEGIFAPDATCTRGQIVTFLYRAMA